jgi:hypothetical protein
LRISIPIRTLRSRISVPIGTLIFVNFKKYNFAYIFTCFTTHQTRLLIQNTRAPIGMSNRDLAVDENPNVLILISGDFNTDLGTNKRYSKYLTRFINENKMICMDYEFPNIKYTYKNGINSNYIDHIIANEIASHYVTGCTIIENKDNMSDHNSILTTILMNIEGNYDDILTIKKNFYRFPWKEEGFVSNFQQIVEEKMKFFEYNLNHNNLSDEKSSYIELKLKELKTVLLQAADKNSQKQINKKNYKHKQKKKIWTTELIAISNELNFWYSNWLISNKRDIKAYKNYKF